jgi:hypothetical protein
MMSPAPGQAQRRDIGCEPEGLQNSPPDEAELGGLLDRIGVAARIGKADHLRFRRSLQQE